MSQSLVRVGILTCARFDHISGIWGPLIDPTAEPHFRDCTTRVTGMVMTHVWDIDREAVNRFCDTHKGVQAVDNYWDMADKVDGIIVSDFDSAVHFADLARPYLEAGVPIFINRPFALNLEKAQEIIDLSKKHDTPIMSGSSFGFAPEIEAIKLEVEAISPVRGFAAANSMSDYASHGIHGLYMIHACIGGGVKSVSYQTPDWRTPNGHLTFEYDPRGPEGKTFYGSLQEISGTWGWIRVFGERSFEQFVDSGLSFWVPILLRMQQMFETRTMPEPYDDIIEKLQMFLAGFKSHVECAGAAVALDDIGDWTAPMLNPNPYPDGFFT